MEHHFVFVCAVVGIWIFLCLEYAARDETLDFVGADSGRNNFVFMPIATLANTQNAEQLETHFMDGMQYAGSI